mgnify:CR=1 FL=1
MPALRVQNISKGFQILGNEVPILLGRKIARLFGAVFGNAGHASSPEAAIPRGEKIAVVRGHQTNGGQ